ncbi:MAG: hypothetical protein IJ496_04830 [Ruminococcus sp.]|nr:hypothetical protein [Ruminococcus sp.]
MKKRIYGIIGTALIAVAAIYYGVRIIITGKGILCKDDPRFSTVEGFLYIILGILSGILCVLNFMDASGLLRVVLAALLIGLYMGFWYYCKKNGK